jgi:hypothetical protein
LAGQIRCVGDKGEKEDLSEFKQTEYWGAMRNFQKFIVGEACNNGLSPERLGEAVHVALSTAKPRARYAVVPQRFKNWILARLLPARMLDAQLTKPQPASNGGFSQLMWDVVRLRAQPRAAPVHRCEPFGTALNLAR